MSLISIDNAAALMRHDVVRLYNIIRAWPIDGFLNNEASNTINVIRERWGDSVITVQAYDNKFIGVVALYADLDDHLVGELSAQVYNLATILGRIPQSNGTMRSRLINYANVETDAVFSVRAAEVVAAMKKWEHHVGDLHATKFINLELESTISSKYGIGKEIYGNPDEQIATWMPSMMTIDAVTNRVVGTVFEGLVVEQAAVSINSDISWVNVFGAVGADSEVFTTEDVHGTIALGIVSTTVGVANAAVNTTFCTAPLNCVYSLKIAISRAYLWRDETNATGQIAVPDIYTGALQNPGEKFRSMNVTNSAGTIFYPVIRNISGTIVLLELVFDEEEGGITEFNFVASTNGYFFIFYEWTMTGSMRFPREDRFYDLIGKGTQLATDAIVQYSKFQNWMSALYEYNEYLKYNSPENGIEYLALDVVAGGFLSRFGISSSSGLFNVRWWVSPSAYAGKTAAYRRWWNLLRELSIRMHEDAAFIHYLRT